MTKKILVAIACVLALAIIWVVALRVAYKLTSRRFDQVLIGVQANLAFNRLIDDRRMAFLLSKGCIDQAKRHVDINQDQDTELLAEFYKTGLPPEAIQYINLRDSKLLSTLGTFKSRYGMRWTEKVCK